MFGLCIFYNVVVIQCKQYFLQKQSESRYNSYIIYTRHEKDTGKSLGLVKSCFPVGIGKMYYINILK